MEFETSAKVVKVDKSLGLVMGYAVICSENGEPYFDLQGDHCPDESMLEAATDFMQSARIAKDMHDSDQKGSVVFAWPLTAEIAKAFGLQTEKTGLMIAMKPSDDEILEKFASGEYTGFSIGGERIDDEEVD